MGQPLAEVIKTKRKELHMSRKELADKISASAGAVYAWETGKSTKIRTKFIGPLADVLGFDPTPYQDTDKDAQDEAVIEEELTEMEAAVAERVRKFRKAGKHTQQTMSDELGLEKRVYRALENGKKRIDLELLLRLSRALEVSADELLGGAQEKTEAAVEASPEEEPKLENWIKQIADAPEDKKKAVRRMWNAVREL
ncbi:hypothetical protein J31TS4_09940 [Paenibacillus sp. J31TS4]|nr:hypothetical protein J31TS4_09940 [Paenibacillus sp. J31TS4]